MPTLQLKYNSRSNSPAVTQANRIAAELHGKPDDEDRKYFIVQSEPGDSRINQLVDLVKNLKGTELLLDGEVVDSVGLYHLLATCKRRGYCQGKCEFIGGNWHCVLSALGMSINEQDNDLPIDETRFNTNEFPGILVGVTKDKLTIDREELIRSFEVEFKLHERLCEVFSKEIYLEHLRRLSDRIVIKKKDYQTLREKSEQDMEKIIDQKIDLVIAKLGKEIEDRLRKVLDDYLKK